MAFLFFFLPLAFAQGAPPVSSTGPSDASYARCISKGYELYFDFTQIKFSLNDNAPVIFGYRRNGEGPFTRDVSCSLSMTKNPLKLKIMSCADIEVELTTPDLIIGEAIFMNWDLGCDFYQNNIYADSLDWNHPYTMPAFQSLQVP